MMLPYNKIKIYIIDIYILYVIDIPIYVIDIVYVHHYSMF